MGEKLALFHPIFSRSIRVEVRPELLSTDPGRCFCGRSGSGWALWAGHPGEPAPVDGAL